MNTTIKWLKNHRACEVGVEWFAQQDKTDHQSLLKQLIKEGKPLDWGSWYLSESLPKIKKVKYAVYAARQVIGSYEKKYPKGKCPCNEIKAAEKYIKISTRANKKTAGDAAYAAYAAIAAIHAAAQATGDTAAKQKLQIKILKYGIKLLVN